MLKEIKYVLNYLLFSDIHNIYINASIEYIVKTPSYRVGINLQLYKLSIVQFFGKLMFQFRLESPSLQQFLSHIFS